MDLWRLRVVRRSNVGLVDNVPVIVSSWNFQELLPLTDVMSMQKVKVTEVMTQVSRFRNVTPVWIHIWWRNDAQSLMLLRRGALLSLNSPMAMKSCTKLEIAQKMCPVVFQGHPSNFRVTWDKKSPILNQIGHFWTVTQFWIFKWIWNDAQSFT